MKQKLAEMWKSRTMATSVIGRFDEKGTCDETGMDVMSLFTSRATWVAVGGGDGYDTPASSATLHLRIVDDRA